MRNVKWTSLRKRRRKKTKNMNNKMVITTLLSTIILIVKGLNASIKRHREAEWIRKQDPYICSLPETHFRLNRKAESKGIENIFHENGNKKNLEWIKKCCTNTLEYD